MAGVWIWWDGWCVDMVVRWVWIWWDGGWEVWPHHISDISKKVEGCGRWCCCGWCWCWLLGLVLVVVVVGGGWCMVAAWLVRGGLWAKKSPAGVDDGAAGVETMCLLGS